MPITSFPTAHFVPFIRQDRPLALATLTLLRREATRSRVEYPTTKRPCNMASQHLGPLVALALAPLVHGVKEGRAVS